MSNPNERHPFRRRRITGKRITGDSHGPYGPYGPYDWDKHVRTEDSLTCDTCGGSKGSLIHLPKRLPAAEHIETRLFGSRKRYLEWKRWADA